jgi:integrin-linked kinase
MYIPALSKSVKERNWEACDMWSFSILLWELATREVPFADLSPMECGMKVIYSKKKKKKKKK